MEYGNHEAVQLLIENGAHVNATTGGFDTTLMSALHQKDKKVTQLLYTYGATPSQKHWIPVPGTAVEVEDN